VRVDFPLAHERILRSIKGDVAVLQMKNSHRSQSFDSPLMSTDQPATGSPVNKTSGWFTVLPSLVTPICVGLSLYFGLQYLINEHHITNETLLRYINGHPVSRLTVGMFLIGLTSLMMIGMNVFAQFSAERQIYLENLPEPEPEKLPAMGGVSLPSEPGDYGRSDAELAVEHGEDLVAMRKSFQRHYLWSRLVNSLHYIYRTGSVGGVEDELKYLAEMDIERQQQRYSLSRILIWATPMLGFLGTVLGISQALGGISVGPENDFQQMMGGLQGSLYIAFDTTALALSLSMVLMFCQFLVDRFEVQLLELVDQKARREIARQFDLSVGAGTNGLGATGLQVLEATRDVVRNQTEIWRNSIKAAENAWSSSLTQTSEVVRENLSAALDENVSNLAHYLGESIEKADLSIAHRWEQWQTLLSSNARLMKDHQESLLSQTDKIQSVVQTLDDTTSFKEALKHQYDSIEATTRMHDVLAQVAKEVSVQSEQLQQQGNQQSASLKTSSDALIQNQKAFEQRIANFTMELPLALPVADPNESTNPISNGSVDGFAKSERRRNPKKPVMFLRSEAVTEIREKTQASKLAVTEKPVVQKQVAQVAQDVQPIAPSKQLQKKKQTITISELKQQLGIKPDVQATVQDASPPLLMPLSNRLRGRVRAEAEDNAERLSLVKKDDGQPAVQRKKAA